MKYTPSEADAGRVKNELSYHPVKSAEQSARYDDNRAAAQDFADVLMGNCPSSPELTQALINLRQAMNWANAAIAINE